ncbi:hypothetical protein CYY_008226 [Polysphondylium violaceum]|uniref:Transmembrane protein n=1 Tax=Polysphondylium violaceum TaxID=133409 RepID=A0A8J4PPL3_9MYCE|nr:hypothetical protein CYY_008226 [Polysphondylium violaceum]
MYFLSQLDENELSYWYIPVNFLGAFFAILFVSTAIIKNHYNILKVKLLLIVACISIAPFIVAYLFVGSEFFFVGLVIVEGLFMLIPFVFLHNIRIERDVSDFYLPIPICFFFVTVFNSIAGFLINDMALIMCGLSGSIPSTILLITYLVMSIRYKTTRIILQEQIIQIIQGEFVFYAAIIPSHKTVKTNMNYPKYYVQPENTLEIQDNKKSINQLDP